MKYCGVAQAGYYTKIDTIVKSALGEDVHVMYALQGISLATQGSTYIL